VEIEKLENENFTRVNIKFFRGKGGAEKASRGVSFKF
jgi:hypothetical protein